MIGVCTLNEADNIETLIKRLRLAIPAADILVVDDESSDGTAELVTKIIEEDPAVMISVRHDARGLGGAIRHAMEYAIKHNYDFFLNLDGDLSHRLPLAAGFECSFVVEIVQPEFSLPHVMLLGWSLA